MEHNLLIGEGNANIPFHNTCTRVVFRLYESADGFLNQLYQEIPFFK